MTPAPEEETTHFERAGFRSYSLTGDGWQIVLQKVDVLALEPKGLVSVYVPGSPWSFVDLDGLVISRSIWLQGTNVEGLAKSIALRLHESGAGVWLLRLDYLVGKTLREVAGGSAAETEMKIAGPVARPTVSPYVFRGRVRVGRTVSLFGPGSAGKTTLADGLVVSLDTGVEVVPGWLPSRAFRVGVLDWDEGKEEEQVRLYAITRAYGVDLQHYHYKRMTRPLAESADQVGRWVVDNAIEVLFIGPVNRASRPSNGDPGGPVHELHEVCREFATTTFLIDHVTGSNIANPGASREYGSIAKRDNVRGSYSVFPQSEAPGRRVVVLSNTKPDALTPRREPEAVRIEFDPPWPDEHGGYESIFFYRDDVEADDVDPAETQPEKLVRILQRAGGRLSVVDICARTGFHADRLRYIARDARARGSDVTASGDGYVIRGSS